MNYKTNKHFVLEDDDFLQVSCARILINISGTVTAIDWPFTQVKDMGLTTARTIRIIRMLLEILKNDDFLEVSSARRLMNILGTVRAFHLKFLQVNNVGLHVLMEGSTAVLPLP
jgi:hypothetical protein